MEIKAILNKPYTETQKLDFIVENNHNLGYEIKETETELQAWGYTEEEKAKEEQQRVLELRMTPLDFLKAIEQYGITYDMVKQFMEENPLIDRELRFCQFVYRKHPMLQSLSEYGITSEVLDTIFRKANGEDV